MANALASLRQDDQAAPPPDGAEASHPPDPASASAGAPAQGSPTGDEGADPEAADLSQTETGEAAEAAPGDKRDQAFARLKRERKELREQLKVEREAKLSLEGRLQSIEAKLTEGAKPAETTQTPADTQRTGPFDTITDPNQLLAERERWEEAVGEADVLLARLGYDAEGVAEAMTKAGFKPQDEGGFETRELGELLLKLKGTASGRLKAIPKRIEAIRLEQQARAEIATIAPETADEDNELNTEINGLMQALPELRLRPDGRYGALLLALGQREVNRRKGSNGSATPKPKTVVPAPRGPGAPGKAPPPPPSDKLAAARLSLSQRKTGSALEYAKAAVAASGEF